jgi:predicted dinucleotide-binding enzyme
MRVGIIGAGNMGSAFARRLGSAGHDVFITSRTLDEAKRVADTLPANVEAVEQSRLADRVDLLIAATPSASRPTRSAMPATFRARRSSTSRTRSPRTCPGS